MIQKGVMGEANVQYVWVCSFRIGGKLIDYLFWCFWGVGGWAISRELTVPFLSRDFGGECSHFLADVPNDARRISRQFVDKCMGRVPQRW